jgi:peptidoglycan/LPS O-acetylase OafA/YrhL
MTNALSLYLDALRFSAAFTVFMGHYGSQRFGGGLFWQMQAYGRAPVLVFFVLSGFVIAWVTETRERTLEEYGLSRVARLYSVIVPAFIVTVVLDYIAMAIDPRLYEANELMNRGPLNVFLGYVLSLVFLGQSWTLMMSPGSDSAFWTVNYEAWYYTLFGLAVFLQGRQRLVALAVAALLAGPKIFVFFPLWLMGLLAWRWRAALPRHLGAPLAFGAVAAFIGLAALGGLHLFQPSYSPWLPFGFSAYDYIVSALAALFIVGLANAPLPMPGAVVERLIRFLAGTTFGLYLLHYPLLHFFGTVIPGPADGAVRRILVFGLTLGVAIAFSHVIEQQKGALKRALRLGFTLVPGKRAPIPVLEHQGLS